MKMSQKTVKSRLENPKDRLVLDMLKFLNGNINLQLDDEHLYKRLMSVNQSLEIINNYNRDADALKMYSSIRKIIK